MQFFIDYLLSITVKLIQNKYSVAIHFLVTNTKFPVQPKVYFCNVLSFVFKCISFLLHTKNMS